MWWSFDRPGGSVWEGASPLPVKYYEHVPTLGTTYPVKYLSIGCLHEGMDFPRRHSVSQSCRLIITLSLASMSTYQWVTLISHLISDVQVKKYYTFKIRSSMHPLLLSLRLVTLLFQHITILTRASSRLQQMRPVLTSLCTFCLIYMPPPPLCQQFHCPSIEGAHLL